VWRVFDNVHSPNQKTGSREDKSVKREKMSRQDGKWVFIFILAKPEFYFASWRVIIRTPAYRYVASNTSHLSLIQFLDASIS
jgi:hypothetical protein